MRTRSQTTGVKKPTNRVKKPTNRAKKSITRGATLIRRNAAVCRSKCAIGHDVLTPAPWEAGEWGIFFTHVGPLPQKGLQANGSHLLFKVAMKELADEEYLPKWYRPDCVIPLKGDRILIDKNWKEDSRPLWTYFNAKRSSKAAWHTFSEWTNKGCKMQIFANLTSLISTTEPVEYPPVFLNYKIEVVP